MKGGGPVESISINARGFAVASDSEPGMQLGGFKAEPEMNGDKTFRNIYEIIPSKVGPIKVEVDHDKDDLKFLQDTVDSKEQVAFSITYVDGNTFSGDVLISGEIEYASKPGTADLTFSGGVLRKQ